MMYPKSNGVAYYAEQNPGGPSRPLWLQAAVFALVFFALQGAYNAVRETWVERLVIETLTVRPAAWSIRQLTPSVAVQPQGARLKAPGGGINVVHGCDGTEVLFLLFAAFAAAVLPWRARLTGVLLGCFLVFGLNLARILALFYTYRARPDWFDMLHGTLAPLLLIGVCLLFFWYWLNRYAPQTQRA